MTVEEIDGAPSIQNVIKILINNGALTDLGGGVAKISIFTNVDGGTHFDPYTPSPRDVDGGTH